MNQWYIWAVASMEETAVAGKNSVTHNVDDILLRIFLHLFLL